jgi:hypothetical protein
MNDAQCPVAEDASMPQPAPAILTLNPSGAESRDNTTPSMWLALDQLLKAHDMARRMNRPKWDFAVEIDALERAGSDHNDLRALICQGLVEHSTEIRQRRPRRRSFRHRAGLHLTPQSCFVLSDWGLAVSSHHSAARCGSDTNGSANSPLTRLPLPVWDAVRRELRLGQIVLKRFRQPAKNQQAILAAFQEDGWPERIDNPIPGSHDENASERLHNTLKRLNRQIDPIIRFHGGGTAEGIIWCLEPKTH